MKYIIYLKIAELIIKLSKLVTNILVFTHAKLISLSYLFLDLCKKENDKLREKIV